MTPLLRTCRAIALALLTLQLPGAAAYAQEAAATEEKDFQRYDLVREPSELTLEALLSGNTETVSGYNFSTLSPAAKVQYTFASRHTISLTLPYTLALYDSPDARQRLYYTPGDLQLSYELLLQNGHLNWFLSPLLSVPLTAANDYAAREGVISGSGRCSLGVNVSVTGIRDPVVWNAGFQYTLGLPRKERFAATWEPGTMRLSAGLTNLLNERFGLALGIAQTLSLPTVTDGVGGWTDPGGVSVSTSLQGEAFVLFEHDYLRLSLDAFVYPLQRPVTLTLIYGHQFTIEKNKESTP